MKLAGEIQYCKIPRASVHVKAPIIRSGKGNIRVNTTWENYASVMILVFNCVPTNDGWGDSLRGC